MPLNWLMRLRSIWLLAAVMLLNCALQAAPAPEALERAIRRLGHAEWKVREEAQLCLWNAGKVAITSLRKATVSPDPEVRYRAGDVLRKLRYGIRPDTPPEEEALLLNFHESNLDTWQQIVRKLSQQGEKAHGTLRLIFGLDLEETERKQFLSTSVKALAQQAVSTLINTGKRNGLPFDLGNLIGQPFKVEFVRALASKGEKGFPHLAEIFTGNQWKDDRPALLKVNLSQKQEFVRFLFLKNDYSTAATVLEEAAATGPSSHILDFVAFQILHGDLEKTIQRYDKRYASSSQKIDAQILTHLCLAKGDFARALDAAKAAEDKKLIRKIELERGDWPALFKRYPAPSKSQRESIEYLGLRLTYARLTGDAAFSEALRDVMNSECDAFKKQKPCSLMKGPMRPLKS